MSTRVRNAGGTVGKALSKGGVAEPPSATIVSESELQRWNELLSDRSESARKKQAEAAEKHELSVHRKDGWNNTVEGAKKAKDETRRRRAEEVEMRKRLIDQEEEDLRKAEKRAVVDNANRQLHERDARVLQMNSQLLLHEVLQEREEQMVISARKKAMQQERERQYDELVLREAEEERQKEKEKTLSARAKAVELSRERMAQLDEQKQQRAAEIRAAREEGLRLRQIAEDDAKQAEAQKLSARSKAREVEVDRIKQLQEKIARTPRRTEGIAQEDPELEERNYNYAVRKAVEHELHAQRLAEKKEKKEEKRSIVRESFVPCSPKKEDAIDKMASARSINDVINDGDAERSSARDKSKKEATHLDRNTAQKKAEAVARQRQRDAAIQQQIARQVEELTDEDREAARRAREDRQALQHFHELQIRQKHINDKAHDNEIREEGVHMQALRSEEDAMFTQYIQSVLPGEMKPELRKKAIVPPKKLVSA